MVSMKSMVRPGELTDNEVVPLFAVSLPCLMVTQLERLTCTAHPVDLGNLVASLCAADIRFWCCGYRFWVRGVCHHLLLMVS